MGATIPSMFNAKLSDHLNEILMLFGCLDIDIQTLIS
jgi:hypothetical protein